MHAMSVREARAGFSALVDRAERGETIVITRHGKQSVRLGPMPAGAQGLTSLSAFRAGMAAPKTGLSAAVAAGRREERF